MDCSAKSHKVKWTAPHQEKYSVFWKMKILTHLQTFWKFLFFILPFLLPPFKEHLFCSDIFKNSFLHTNSHKVDSFCFQLLDRSFWQLGHFLLQLYIQDLDELLHLVLPFKMNQLFLCPFVFAFAKTLLIHPYFLKLWIVNF